MARLSNILIKSVLAIIPAAIWNCDGPPEDGPIDGASFSKTYIQLYVIPNELSMQDYHRSALLIEFRGRDVHFRGTNDEQMKKEFEELSIRYGDVSYNRKLVPFMHSALGTEYESITVTCDKALDAEHPAGTPLDDIIKLCAQSARDYIASGYNKGFKVPERPEGIDWMHGWPYIHVFKYLNEVTPSDLVLINECIYLYFTQIPPPGEYNFTVTVSDGIDNLTGNVSVTF